MAFGDFTVTRASTKNILGSAGLYVSVANNVPAFEFNTDGTYRGLLVEPGATNLMLRSQEFDNASWVKAGNGTGLAPVVTANDAVAPDGTTTADLIVFDRGAGDTSNDRSSITQTATVVNATAYTASVFLKAGSAGDVGKQIALRHVANAGWLVVTLTADWVRYERAETSASTSGTWNLQNRGGITADNTVSVHAWQAQLETGSVATSPIVTTAGTASRVADVVSLTGASSLIGQTEGTLYAEVIMRSVGAVGRSLLDINDGTTNNRISLLATGTASDLFRFSVIVSGVAQCQFDSSFTSNTLYKTAIAYKANDFTAYINGVSLGTDTSGTVPALSQITIGNLAGEILQLNGWIRSVALYTTRLSNAQLASLTA
jgi:hypothetical protein